MESRLLVALRPLAQAFEAMGVRFQVGGSLSSSVRGVPRSSLDVDLLADLEPTQIDELVSRLAGQYYVSGARAMEAVRRGASFNVIHLGTMTKIDVFVAKTDRFRRKSLERGTVESLSEDFSAYVATAEDIALHKLAWFRKGGEVSSQQWQDVIGIVKVQGERLDLSYLRQWARELEVGDLLERALSEARA
jgi:hypothetical protein